LPLAFVAALWAGSAAVAASEAEKADGQAGDGTAAGPDGGIPLDGQVSSDGNESGDAGGHLDGAGSDALVEVDAGCADCTDGVCINGVCCHPQGSTETACDDGVDDDCDGLKDCADSDCNGQSCDDGNTNTTNDSCDVNTAQCVGVPCTWVEVCQECPTGDCEDVLIHEDPGCGCATSVPAPSCDMQYSPYDVPCGGGYICTFERRHIMAECNCHDECQP